MRILSFIAIFMSIASTSAFALDVPLLTLVGDGCNIRIPFGLQVSQHSPTKVEGLYYYDDVKVRKFFSIEDLKKLIPAVTIDGHLAAYLQLSPGDRANEFDLRIKYLRSFIAVYNRYPMIELTIRYNVQANRYELLNPKDGRPAQNALVTPNTIGGKLIGISQISFQ